VSALVERNWLRLIASYFALNYLFEAFSWLKDRSNEDTIKNIDPEVKKQFLAEMDGPTSAEEPKSITD